MKMILKNDEKAVFALRELYQQYGYLPYKMSRFEEYDLYVQNKDFLVSDQVITFSDRKGRLLALKPDVTLSIIKNVTDQPGSIQKVYYNENVYRVDKGTQAFKEIMQAGLECVGDLGEYEVAEAVLLAAKSLSLLGESFVLDISHTGLLETVIAQSGLSETEKVQAMTCLRQKNRDELLRLCQNCSERNTAKLLALASCSGAPENVLPRLRALMTEENELLALDTLASLCGVLEAQGLGRNVCIDFSVGSDMRYYSGVVFKGYLEGVPASILSGGQYDKLLRNMGKSSHAIGFAIYLDLLQRLDNNRGFDVDIVLLYDGKTDASGAVSAAECLRKNGSVLVSTALPQDRTWRKVYRYRNGEAILIEDNG